MIQEIHDPLSEYVKVFRERFRSVAQKTFDDLSSEANVDVEANRKTCREIYAAQQELSEMESRISNWTFVRTIFWIFFAIGLVLFGITVYHSVSEVDPYVNSELSLIFLGVSVLLLILNLVPNLSIHAAIRKYMMKITFYYITIIFFGFSIQMLIHIFIHIII